MKHRDDEWHPDIGPDGHGRGPSAPPIQHDAVDDDHAPEGEPQSFAAMRRIEFIGRLHHMTFSSILATGGLSPAQSNALKAIIHNPGMSQRQLGDELHIQRATTTVMLQKMEKAGYIDRRPDPVDQRVYRIYPTESAIAMEEETHKDVDNYFATCFDGFTQSDFDKLNELLARLGTNIRSVSAGPDKFPPKE